MFIYKICRKAIVKNRYRRVALKKFALILEQDIQQRNDYQLLSSINQLLKAVSIKIYPNCSCAAFSGERWQRFLALTIEHHEHFDVSAFEVLGKLYQADQELSDKERKALINSTQLWIKKHLPGEKLNRLAPGGQARVWYPAPLGGCLIPSHTNCLSLEHKDSAPDERITSAFLCSA